MIKRQKIIPISACFSTRITPLSLLSAVAEFGFFGLFIYLFLLAYLITESCLGTSGISSLGDLSKGEMVPSLQSFGLLLCSGMTMASALQFLLKMFLYNPQAELKSTTEDYFSLY